MQIFLSCFAIGLLQSNYSLHPDSKSLEPGEISAGQSHIIGQRTAARLGIQNLGTAQIGLNAPSNTRRYWDVVWDEISIQINSKTGRLTGISNWQKQDDLHAGRQMPATYAISNEQQAAARLREIFQISGSPENFELRNLRLTEETGTTKAVASAGAFVRFRSRRLVGPYCSVSIDRFDGKLISLDQSWDYQLETEEPVLQANAARTRSEQLYFANRVESDRYPMNAGAPELIYIRRQGGYGSTATSLGEPIARLRIAFSVKFGPDQVNVDAVTGQSMGGVVSRDRPH